MTTKWRPANWKTSNDIPTKGGRKANKYFEKGADAMLEALRERRKWRGACYQENGRWITDPMIVDIPDDPQPVSNPSKSNPWCPAHGYPLPCAKCGLKDYVEQPEWLTPSEWTKEAGKVFTESEKLYPPDTAYFIKKWQLHKATKVIENGYFCPFCFDQQPYTVGGFINYHRCPNNNMVLSGYD